MKPKSTIYFILAIALVAGGALLAAKGKDAVSLAENRKQAVLEAEPGDRIAQGTSVAAVENKGYYADFYIQESRISKFKAGQAVRVHFPYAEGPDETEGVVTAVTAAPQFASLRMSREKGQADLSMYAVRIAIDANADLLPGMTAEVKLDEIAD